MAGAPFSPGASGMPVVLFVLNKIPVASSLMVAVPTALDVPVLVAVKVKVSSSSANVSFVIVVRTNKVVLAICTKLSAV